MKDPETFSSDVCEWHKNYYRCSHCEEDGHSCTKDTCYLSLYGFHILMYGLGDKYDILGLRKYSCKRLRQTFIKVSTASWEHRLIIFDMMYQHSRVNDELREIIIDMVYDSTSGGWYDYLLTWDHGPKLLQFLDRSPELCGPILKCKLEGTWAAEKAKSQWGMWGTARPPSPSPPPPWGSITGSPSSSHNQT